MGSVSRKQPLYDQLVDTLSEKIENEMEPGDLLPSERDLCELYGLSRTTVRLAMSELEERGMVARRHGKGTYVTHLTPQRADLMGTYSFTRQMKSLGRVPSNQVLEFDIREASKPVAVSMGIPVGEKIYRARRIRLADDVPLMIERTYLPTDIFPGLTEEALVNRPLYDTLENEYGQKINLAEESLCARTARGDEAGLLGVPEGSPVLHLVRTTTNDKNIVIEYTRSVARADMFEYKICHVRY